MSLLIEAKEKYQTDGLGALLFSAIRYPFWRSGVIDFAYGLVATARGDHVEYNGVQLDLSHPGISKHIKTSIAKGSYEDSETVLVDEWLPADTDVIELGGGMGYLSCYINTRLNDDCRHLCVEANEMLCGIIEDHMALNDCDFTTLQAAYDPDGESSELFLMEDFWSGSTVRTSEQSIAVDGKTLEDLCEHEDVGRFALIADIEGGEAGLLTHELDVLAAKARLVMIEFHDEKRGFEEIAGDIKMAREELERHSAFRLVDQEGGVYVYRNVARSP